MLEFPLTCDSCDHVYESAEDVVVTTLLVDDAVSVKGYACPQCTEPMFPGLKRFCNLPLLRRYMMLQKLMAMEDVSLPATHPTLSGKRTTYQDDPEPVFSYTDRVNEYTYLVRQPEDQRIDTGETCLLQVSDTTLRAVVVESDEQQAVVEVLGTADSGEPHQPIRPES